MLAEVTDANYQEGTDYYCTREVKKIMSGIQVIP